MNFKILDPETKEVIQEYSDDEFKCRAMKGMEPINEACGGCVGCIELQAIHWGYPVKYEGELDYDEYQFKENE